MVPSRRMLAPASVLAVALITACGPSAAELARAKAWRAEIDAAVASNQRVAYEREKREEERRRAEEAAREAEELRLAREEEAALRAEEAAREAEEAQRLARAEEARRAAEAAALAKLQADAERDGMAVLPGGTYVMGEMKETVTVAPFALDRTEVTVAMYSKCVGKGDCSAEGVRTTNFWGTSKWDRFCNWGKAGKREHPMNCVDWYQATAYCQWAGKRLPTEAEWEWAARGQARGTLYPWGNEPPEGRACWNRYDFMRDTGTGTCAVAAFPTGDAPGGIHDLAGNVWEWTSTALDVDEEVAVVDDAVRRELAGVREHRLVRVVSSARVNRGGSWGHDDPSFFRAAFRSRIGPSSRGGDLGFRCARGPGPTPEWLAVEATRRRDAEERRRQAEQQARSEQRGPHVKGPVGRASVGGAQVKGGSIANAAAVVAKMSAGFRRCYQKGLAENPEMKGSIRLRAKIGPHGEVLEVEPEGGAGLSDTVIKCIMARAASSQFAEPDDGSATVTIPVSLSSE
jgi:formylglycine-generating enzyme required for sulfatase activity